MTIPTRTPKFAVVSRLAQRSHLKLLFAMLLLASCQADYAVLRPASAPPRAVAAPSPSAAHAFPNSTTPFVGFSPVQGNTVVGEMVGLQGGRIVVQDAAGLHLVNSSTNTRIYKAVGNPVPQIQEIQVQDLAPPQTLWIIGAATNEAFHAVRIDVNYFIGRAGIIKEIGANRITARLQAGGKLSNAFEDRVSTLWISPSTRIQIIVKGVPIPAKLEEAQSGTRMILDGYVAEDGSILAANLLLTLQ